MKLIKISIIIAALCLSTVVMGSELYVNPKGNDAWSGKLKSPNERLTDGPFKTLERAKQAIRELKKTNHFKEKLTVNIAGGQYFLDQALHFNLLDSGLPGREIVWQGDPSARVIVSGGMPLSCNKRDAKLWVCPITKKPANNAVFDVNRIKGFYPKMELYVDGQKMQLARWPNKDWAHIKIPLDSKTNFSVMETLPKLSGNIKKAQVHIFAGNDWHDEYIELNAVDMSANSLKLSSETVYPLESGRRFYLQNLQILLDVPGEWVVDEQLNMITLIPPPEGMPGEVSLSSLPNAVLADNLKLMSFRNIGFQQSTGTALVFNNSSDILLEKIDISGTGGKGVEIKGGQNVQLRNSIIHHTGFTAVSVSGGDKLSLKSSGHEIYNNHIHHLSTVIMSYTPGIEINGVGVKVTHNLLEQGPHNAITIAGNNHLIDRNELHHFCLQTADAGAIYSGRNWSWRGNVIRNNYIHDIIGFELQNVDMAKNQVSYSAAGARGVYLDDGVSGFTVIGNIFENAGAIALQVGGGRDHIISNNYFKTSGYAIWLDTRGREYDWSKNQAYLDESPYKSKLWQKAYPELAKSMHNKIWPEGNTIERNIIVTDKPSGTSLRYHVPKDSTVIRNNLIWSTIGLPSVDYEILELNKNGGGAAWTQWLAEGIEQDNVVGDPCVTINHNKMLTCAGSPIKDIGFKALPTDIGLLSN